MGHELSSAAELCLRLALGYAVVTPTGQERVANASAVVDLVSREAMPPFTPLQSAAMAEMLGQLAGIPAPRA